MAQLICNVKTSFISSKEVYLVEFLKELHNFDNKFVIHNSVISLKSSISSSSLLRLRVNSNKNNLKTYFEQIQFEISDSSYKKVIQMEFELFKRIVEKYPQISQILFNQPLIETKDLELFKIEIINPCLKLEGSTIILLDFENKMYSKIWNSIDNKFKNPSTNLVQTDFYEEWKHSQGRRFAF